LLDRARCFDDLRSALHGLGRTYAFSARLGKFRQPRSSLVTAAAAIGADPSLRAALVFGREDSGLTTAEIEQAHELVTIPVPGTDPVLNLSHAATIALWEVARAREIAPVADHRGRPRTATAEDRAALRDEFAALLTETGLPPGRHGDLHRRIVRRFVDLFDRAGAEHADFGLLRGVFVAFRRTVARLPAADALAAIDGSLGEPGCEAAPVAESRRSARRNLPRTDDPCGSS
jgi:TrmH family RNA methyltransferase